MTNYQIHTKKAGYWHELEDGYIQCDLCPRLCQLKQGQHGVCYIRENRDGEMVLSSYGRSSGFCIDPIEKKPLNHFYPGSSVLSFGTAGCNLTCKFCQNWDISRSRNVDRLGDQASPKLIAQVAGKYGCDSVAYTYNDPVIFHEYAVDVAQACREQGIYSVAVSAGYVMPEPRMEFYRHMDAANIDLKGFNEVFYRKLCGAHLAPVLETLEYLVHETEVWLELTTLLIPGENDSQAELEQLCQWVVEHLGAWVPVHFTAFHPGWKMRDIPPTPISTLQRAYHIAKKAGLYYPYTGNVHDLEGGSSYCHHCGKRLITRDWYELSLWNLDDQGRCNECGTPMAGRLVSLPGTWGSRRQPIDIRIEAQQQVR